MRLVDDGLLVDGDAMSTDAPARLQDTNAQLVVCHRISSIDTDIVASSAKPVRTWDVEVTKGAVDQRRHFGGLG